MISQGDYSEALGFVLTATRSASEICSGGMWERLFCVLGVEDPSLLVLLTTSYASIQGSTACRQALAIGIILGRRDIANMVEAPE